jgi:MoaA/NifB/PqqE/SkfB family radical SAM enzyme
MTQPGAAGGSRPPKVYVEPTNASNQACATSVRHAGVEGLTGRAPAATGRTPDAPGTVAFMGLGEPLLHPRFLDMVRLAKERGLRAEVTTNALLLDEVMAAGLLDAGLDQLVVSIDGASAEAFGRVRSGASLERVVENVRRLDDHEGNNYGSSVRIGVEFVAMRSNVAELPGLGRLAARLGATFIIVSNVLAYTPELQAETLYDHRSSVLDRAETPAAPRWQLPAFDWDGEVGAALGHALLHSGPVSFYGAEPEDTRSRCPFVHAGACAVSWHGGVSPCPPLLHSYPVYVRGREKQVRRWEVGTLASESLTGIWRKPEYEAFRERVLIFDFPPCTDCGCELAETNEEDCLGNEHPTCGDCLWARGVVRCA